MPMSSFLSNGGTIWELGGVIALLGVILGVFSFPGILGWWFLGPRRARAGSDILMKMEIELADAARGCSRTVECSRHDVCAGCAGSGWRKGASIPTCAECRGRGEIITIRGLYPAAATCPTCAGHGPPITDPCAVCEGAGGIPGLVRLQIDVPPGVESGMWLQLRNQGELGDIGALRGNLKIQVLVTKHPVFDRRKNDLYSRVEVTAASMSEGAEVQVPTLDGTCPLRIPRGTHSGDLLRIKKRGMPDIGGTLRGDMVVEVVLETPRN
jgi:molecular chaperone DnaJ